MSRISGLINFLSDEEMKSIHEGALYTLEKVGVLINHEDGLNHLAESGAKVDWPNKRVRFPTELVDSAIENMHRALELHPGKDGRETMPIAYTSLYFTTMPRAIHQSFTINCGAYPLNVLSLDGKRNRATLQDVRDSIRLADGLDNIDFVGPPCISDEVPNEILPIVAAAELVKNTSKPGGIEAWTKKQVDYISQIAVVVRGSEEELKRRPFLVGYAGARSPLSIDFNPADVFIENVRRGFPQFFYTMPCGGTTAPATMLGTLTQGLAEALAGLVLGYAYDPSAFVIPDVVSSFANMRTGSFSLSGPDVIVLHSAMNQLLAQFYKRPGGVHGGRTDACFSGVQAGIEKALSTIVPLLSGATGIGNIGMIEGNITFSYEQLVIDDEIARMIKHIFKGVRGEPDLRALNIIEDVGPGGNYLIHPHTAEHFRDEFWISSLAERLDWGSWEAQGVRGMENLSRDKAQTILAKHHPEPLDESQVNEIDKIVAAAQDELVN